MSGSQKDNINYNYPQIIKKFFDTKKWNNKDSEYYYIVLAAACWLFDNDENKVKEYYKGLKTILPYIEIQYKEENKFITELKNIDLKRTEALNLLQQENALIPDKTKQFPDCGSTFIRNFIQIILFDKNTKKYNLEELNKLDSIDDIKLFFTIYPYEEQFSTSKKIFKNELMTARDAWSSILFNLNNVKYLNNCRVNNNIINYEISAGLNKTKTNENILEVFKNIFKNILKWEDFSTYIENMEVRPELDKNSLGYIYITKNNIKYTGHLESSHYYIDLKTKKELNISYDYSSYDNKLEEKYLRTYKIPLKLQEYNLIDYFYYYNITNEKLLNFLNNKSLILNLDTDVYYKLLIYMKDIYSNNNTITIPVNYNNIKSQYIKQLLLDNKFKRHFDYKIQDNKIISLTYNTKFINPNIFKQINFQNLKKITFNNNDDKKIEVDTFKQLKNLEQFCYKSNNEIDNFLDILPHLKILKLPEYSIKLNNSLDKLINLQELELGEWFTKNLNNSLDELINLQKLTFGEQYNKPLINSLANLINLKILIFGKRYNQKLYNSLDNLINLQKLTFGYNYNRSLDNSLDKLTNLQELTFGYNYNRTLKNSLNKLINLHKLTFGNAFNKELGSSLNELKNLQELTFGEYYNKELGSSLNELKNLKVLILSYNYNQKIGSSLNELKNLRKLFLSTYTLNDNPLDNLTNLQELTFSNRINIKLGNSLNKLQNLQILNLGSHYNTDLGTSLNALTNLQKLYFGHNYKLDKIKPHKYSFNQPLGNSFDKLINLQELHLSYNFNQILGTSLDKLENLQELYFGNKFKTLYNQSLNTLTNLEILRFGNDFNPRFRNNELDNLTNIKKIILDYKYKNINFKLNKKNHPKLEEIIINDKKMRLVNYLVDK